MILEPGMVISVEPGICVPARLWSYWYCEYRLPGFTGLLLAGLPFKLRQR